MVKLTEDMVVARSKGSDLHNVRKLNCWGSELSDVSVVRKLENVEVLSLSVNRISTLADFQHCPNLQELYIRKNNISDINEILYLRQLPKLKSLWLADNPCAEFEQYRLTVLRALPHLQKLDNVAVDSEEVQQAMVCGVPLPATENSRGDERELPRSSSMGESLRSESGGGSSLSDCSPPSSERRYSQTTTPTRSSHQDVYGQSLDDDYEYSQAVYEDDEQPVTRRMGCNHYSDNERRTSQMSQQSNQASSPQADDTLQQHYGGRRGSHSRQQTCNSAIENNQYTRRLSNSQASSGYNSASSNTNGLYYRADPDNAERLRRESYSSTQSPSRRSSQITAEADSSADTRGRRAAQERDQRWCEPEERERAYSRGDGYGYAAPPYETQRSPGSIDHRNVSQDPRYTQPAQSRGDSHAIVQQHYDSAYRRAEQQIDTITRAVASERTSPTKPYPARPKTRNANLLSAVLCLVKELDYTSLEVVEMAVRCRMEELDD
ncbi:dynein axonemal assembly factor 11 isoform X9 [Cherax quadricarinatus]|uniref:dynein axonemal assembly factor 11 isoform X9 n=1 Tax=Cherax quadricarinatus TaxID=27406 RepID=UPI00387E5002